MSTIEASVTGRHRTWTGRIVSEADWEVMSDWDRHGPAGRMWSGLTQRWEPAETAAAPAAA
jgi:hypothetical protein